MSTAPRIDATPPPLASEVTRPAAGHDGRGPTRPIRILLVDDSPDFLESAAAFIASEPGLAVVGSATSGLEAVDRVAELAPDLVLMDVAMPHMNGLEATRRIKQVPAAPKVLLVSMYDSAEHRQAAEAAGADGYVGKWEFAGSIAAAIRAMAKPTGTEALDPRAARLRTLAHLNQVISSSLDMDEVLLAIARAASELMSAPSASFWLADERTQRLTRRAWSNRAIEADQPVTSLAYGEGVVVEAAALRRIIPVSDVASDRRFVARDWARCHGITSVLAVPVVVRGELFAVLALGGPRPFALGPEEHDLLDTFVAQAGAAIRNARLYDEARRGRDFLRSIAENSADAILTTDIAGRITYVSPAGEAMLGGPASELVGRRVQDLPDTWLADPAQVAAMGREILLGRSIRNHETRIRARDGHVMEVSTSLAPLRDASGAVIGSVATLRDVTEQKRTEEALRDTEKLTTMGTLLAGVAHELNNPLAVLLGQSDLLEERAAALDDAALVKTAGRISRAADRCARIVRSFLALARRHAPERAPVSLNAVVREALELLAYPLRVDGVEVKTALAQDLPFAMGDAHQLHQVVVNLLSNAHQAMRATDPPRRLRLATQLAGDRLVLEVADSGPGVPDELRTRIFEPFFTTKPAGQGTGLGLSLCHGIVASHGGSIRVDRAPGRGALFVVELPATPVDRTGAAAMPAPAVPAPPRHVLVVDDEAAVAELVADLLTLDGHTVDVVADGRAAVERLETAAFDLILCDVRMPGMGGRAFLEAIRRRHPALLACTVLMTGDLLDTDTIALVQDTGIPVLGKPFDSAELRRVLGSAGWPAP